MVFQKLDILEAKTFLNKSVVLCVEVLEYFLCNDMLPTTSSSPRVAATTSGVTGQYDICEIAKLLFSAYKQVFTTHLSELTFFSFWTYLFLRMTLSLRQLY